jgi:tripartite-type tricarboxylate transporter receptor subunit TctC
MKGESMLRSVAAIALAVLSGVASAQGFPSRPLRILVPFPPRRQLLTGAKPEGR